MLRHGCDQVIPLGVRELEKLLGNLATHSMQSPIIAIGVAAPVPEPTCEWFNRTRIQLAPENVE